MTFFVCDLNGSPKRGQRPCVYRSVRHLKLSGFGGHRCIKHGAPLAEVEAASVEEARAKSDCAWRTER